MEDLIEQLKEFDYYKRLIKNDMTNGRNVIVERKDGTHAILHQRIGEKPIAGLDSTIDEIERVTIFIGDKEYEFVACQ